MGDNSGLKSLVQNCHYVISCMPHSSILLKPHVLGVPITQYNPQITTIGVEINKNTLYNGNMKQ